MPGGLAGLRAAIAADSPLRRVGAAWFLANAADGSYLTALSIHAFELDGTFALALIGARLLPGALLGGVLYKVLARHPPPRVLQLLSLARCVIVAGAGLVLALDAPLAVLVGIVAVDATILAAYRPLQGGILPALSSTPRELSKAAGSVPSSKALAQAAGALTAGLVLNVLGAEAIVAIAVGVLLVAALLMVGVRADPPAVPFAPRAPSERAHAGFGLVARGSHPLLILGGARSVTRGLWATLTVVVSLRLLHMGSAGVGIIGAAAGIGAAIAVPASLHFAGRSRLAGPGALSFAMAGIPILLIGVYPEAVAAVVLIAAWGLAFALADSISTALIHRVIEVSRLAPSVAALDSSKLLLEGVGSLAAPALVALVGVRSAVVIVGAPLPLLVLAYRSSMFALDSKAETHARPLEALRHTPSFAGMTMLSLESVAARLKPQSAVPGEVIVRQGELGERFYLIDEGRVEVTMDGYPVAVLGASATFGEKALLRQAPRSATVTALVSTRMWHLDASDFIAAATGLEGPTMQRAPGAHARSLEQVLGAVPLFAALDARDLGSLGEIHEARAGAAVVTEGEPGDRFYVILDGEAHVSSKGLPLRTLVAGDCFGEIALLHSVTRTATVVAACALKLWSLEREAFLRLVGRSEWASQLVVLPQGAASPPAPATAVGLIV